MENHQALKCYDALYKMYLKITMLKMIKAVLGFQSPFLKNSWTLVPNASFSTLFALKARC